MYIKLTVPVINFDYIFNKGKLLFNDTLTVQPKLFKQLMLR